MDYNEIPNIIERNKIIIGALIKEYCIPRTLEQLLTRFERIILSYDMQTKRLRLLGVERYPEDTKNVYEMLTDGMFVNKTIIPTKQIQLYVLKKKQIETMEQDKIENIKLILTCFIDLYNQIRSANEILLVEDSAINLYKKLNIIK